MSNDIKWLAKLASLKRWQMWAVTREAYVVQVAFVLTELGIDARNSFFNKLLGVPNSACVDTESCQTLLDKDFAEKTIVLAKELVKKRPASDERG